MRSVQAPTTPPVKATCLSRLLKGDTLAPPVTFPLRPLAGNALRRRLLAEVAVPAVAGLRPSLCSVNTGVGSPSGRLTAPALLGLILTGPRYGELIPPSYRHILLHTSLLVGYIEMPTRSKTKNHAIRSFA